MIPSGKHLDCSFCGKSKNKVKWFISGPSVYICDECLVLSVGIIRESDPDFLRETTIADDAALCSKIGVDLGPVRKKISEFEADNFETLVFGVFGILSEAITETLDRRLASLNNERSILHQDIEERSAREAVLDKEIDEIRLRIKDYVSIPEETVPA